jgi:hypothetical protein
MRVIFVFLALACLSLVPAAPRAGGHDASVRADASALWVNEVRVLSLRTSLSGLSSVRRVEALAKRVHSLDSGTRIWVRTPTQRRVIKRKHHKRRIVVEPLPSRILMGGERVLLEITPREAEAQGSNPPAMAAKWATDLHGALILPPLRLETKSARIPVGGQTSVGLTGSAAANASISSSDPSVAGVVHRPGTVVLKAGTAGTVNVSIQAGEWTQTIAVRVEPYAAKFPQMLTANVVGAPATADLVAAAVEGVVKTSLATEPNRQLRIITPRNVHVRPGESKSIPVRVHVTAPDTFAAEGLAIVRVVNAGLAARDEDELWYCNEPESLKGPGVLFRGELKPERPVRMLYHHINDSPQVLYLDVEVHNTDDRPARMVVMPGDSRPDANAVRAGLQAAEPFFQAWLTGSGEVVTIPPHCRMPLSFRRLGKNECGRGLAYLRLLPGGADTLVVHADARVAVVLNEPWIMAAGSSTPWREVGTPTESTVVKPDELSDLVFPNPFSEESVDYQVGGKFAFGRIGQKPIPRKTKGDPLQGNFGVISRINATAHNPTDHATEVEVVFDASAGYSGALFVIDGVLRRLPLMQPKTEYQLARFRLGPGEKRSIHLVTIPLSGSSYPATVVVRPVDAITALGARR